MKSCMSVWEMSCQWGVSESRVHKRQAGHISGPERFGCSWQFLLTLSGLVISGGSESGKNRVSRKARRTFTYDDES